MSLRTKRRGGDNVGVAGNGRHKWGTQVAPANACAVFEGKSGAWGGEGGVW